MNLDLTKLPGVDRTIPLCEVIDIPAGDPPKFIVVQLPGLDGSRVLAYWTGSGPLTTGDFVEIRKRAVDKQYRVVDTDGGTSGSVTAESVSYDNATSGLTATDVQAALDELAADTGGTALNSICDGRLTLFSSTPYLTFSVTGATTVYFTPTGRGGQIALYDGADWQTIFLTEKSVAVPSVSLRLFDIFGYLSAGDLALETVNWSSNIQSVTDATNATPIVITTSASHGLSANNLVSLASIGGNTAANGIWSIANVAATTFELEGSSGSGAYTSGGTMRQLDIGRATGLVKQDGVWSKSGDTTRRYLGTGMTTITSGQTAFSPATNGGDLLLWNYYNQKPVSGITFDFTSHTYTGGARVYRGQNGNKVSFIIGLIEEATILGISSEFNFDSGDSEVVTGVAINRTGALTFSNRISDVGHFRYTTDFGPFYTLNTGFNFLQIVQTGGATSPDFLRAIIRAAIMM